MAVVSWSNSNGTFYVNMAALNIIATGASVNFNNLPTFSMKANSSYFTDKRYVCVGCYYDGSWYVDQSSYSFRLEKQDGTLVTNTSYLYAHTTSTVSNNTYGNCTWINSASLATSNIFTASNKNDISVTYNITIPSTGRGWVGNSFLSGLYINNTTKQIVSTVTVTLNVPPTVTLGTPTFPTPYVGVGTYTVPITTAEAKYGGDISKVTLTVGQDSTEQTYSAATISNQTISVIPTAAGTYTPTITIEDSRGQTKTETLPQIVVNPYLNPSLDFDVVRTNNNGVKDDEGAYGLITANISFTDAVADLVQPTVKINGTTTNNVTWYSAYNASTGVSSAISDWSDVSSGDTIYGLINGSFAQTDSYQITVRLTDSLGRNSSEITQTLSTAFYTIDFQAGGKEIAFGAPANDNLSQHPNGLFKCAMDVQFEGDVSGVTGSGTSIPTADEVAEFDSSAKMNSTDMTSAQVDDFVDGLNVSGGGLSNTETDYNTSSLASGVTIPSSGFLLMTKASASAACSYSVVVTRKSVAMPSISQSTPSGTIVHTCLPVMKGDTIKLVSGYTGSPYAKLIAYA